MIFSKAKKTTKDETKLIDRFNALGDKTRYKLFYLLNTENEICVSELAERIGISNAGVSQQLKVLEQAGLIERNRMGQKICYTVDAQDEINKKVLKIIGE